MESTRKRSLAIASATVAVIGVLCIVGALQLPFRYAGAIGPAWLPLLIGAALVASAIALLAGEWRDGDPVEWTDLRGWLRIGAIFGALIVFLLLATLTAFAIGVFVFVLLFLTIVSDYSWLKRLVTAGLTAAVVHLTFITLLGLPLPGWW